MNLNEFNQLKKLMTLSTSDNDAEALASLRAATRLLVKNGFTWAMALDRVIKVVEAVEPIDDSEHDPELAEAFEIAMRSAGGRFLGTLQSIQDDWHRQGFLSPRQRAVVLEAAEKAR